MAIPEQPSNIFAHLPTDLREEVCEILLQTKHLTLERIISAGQATPEGTWYDQETNEWVLVLQGQAGVLFEGDAEAIVMQAGDYVHIPAHRRHRVVWTDATQETIWLALHDAGEEG